MCGARGGGWGAPAGVWPAARLILVCFPAHPLPPFAVGDKQPMILKWRILSATNDLDRVSAVALPKLPISLTNTDLKVASDTQFYPGLGTAPSPRQALPAPTACECPRPSARLSRPRSHTQGWPWPFTTAASTSCTGCHCRAWPSSTARPPRALPMSRPSSVRGPAALLSTSRPCSSPGLRWPWSASTTMGR